MKLATTLNHAILLLGTTAALSACGVESLTPLVKNLGSSSGRASLDAHVCTAPPAPAEQNLKYLFILDHSGSNKPAISGQTDDVNNTDSTGSRRYGPLINFISNLTPSTTTHTSFGLIDFSTGAANPTVASSKVMSTFETSATFLTDATYDWIGGGTSTSPSPNDSGFTNYVAALNKAKSMIYADLQANAGGDATVKSTYVIIFVSDGVPTVTSGSTTTTQTFTSDVGPAETDLLSLSQDATYGKFISTITVNTAYYFLTGSESQPAETLLGQMSNLGNGQSLNFATGRNVLYEQFSPPVRNLSNSLVDVFVENKNLVWWDDGSLLADTDGDGLPDSIEIQFGSNPSLADSDGNGVNDLVEYRMKGKPCNSATCAAAARDTYSSCLGFDHSTTTDGRITFVGKAGDGLNDCEKFTLGALTSSYNSNGNFIPDELAYRFNLPIVAGTDQTAFSDIFSNGINNYNKIKQNLPISVSLNALLNYIPQTTLVTPEASSQTGVSCYHVQVNNIPLAFGSNSLRMMVVQNVTALENKPFMTSASVVLPDGGTSASFGAGDFK